MIMIIVIIIREGKSGKRKGERKKREKATSDKVILSTKRAEMPVRIHEGKDLTKQKIKFLDSGGRYCCC